jgi:hypothetical protein
MLSGQNAIRRKANCLFSLLYGMEAYTFHMEGPAFFTEIIGKYLPNRVWNVGL